MTTPVRPKESLVAADLERQVAHWLAAARTFRDAEEFASLEAWRSVERDIGAPLRQHMHDVVEEMIRLGEATAALVRSAGQDPAAIQRASAAVQRFRRRYIQVDVTLDFIGDAVNSRTSPMLRVALTALDRLAVASMAPVLQRAPAFRKDDTPLNRKPGGLMEQSNASLQRGDQG